MRLSITTPTAVVIDTDHVQHVRAEDETGAFGILPGHADLVTVLTTSVITWRNEDGVEHHVAVRGGVLTVRQGNLVEVASRDAVGEDTLQRLGQAVLEELRQERASEQESRVSATRLQLATIRQLERYLAAGRPAAMMTPAGTSPGAPALDDGLGEDQGL